MAADSGPIKTGLSVVLNHEPTDVPGDRTVGASAQVLETFPHVHRLSPPSKYVPHGRIGFSASLQPEERDAPLDPNRKLECLTHLCLVSVFLDYSILSGPLPRPREMKRRPLFLEKLRAYYLPSRRKIGVLRSAIRLVPFVWDRSWCSLRYGGL